MSDKPNILFINTDQQSWNALSAYGNKYVRTPHMDLLHQHGTSFMRAYCTDPVCSPTRASWATGLYSSETGVPFNGGSLHAGIPDLGEILNANGYNAFHCGKWNVPGRDVRKSFHTLYFGKRDIVYGGAEYYDAVSTHAVADFLTSYDEKKPFYLQLGYINPHDICEYLHNHEEKDIPSLLGSEIVAEDELPPLPVNFYHDQDETYLHNVCRRADNALIIWPILRAVRKWDEYQWRYFIWNYYRFVERVDREIGIILAILNESRFRDNTLIFLTSDHGESCGHHRMFQKFTLYEESIRVPFVMACLGDGIPLRKAEFDQEHFVSGVDVMPTVLDYAGIPVPVGVQGASIRPLVERRETSWRSHCYIEANYWGRAIRLGRFKYVTEYVPKQPEDFIPPGPDSDRLGAEQLFDLDEDQWEMKNIAHEVQYRDVISQCREALWAQEARLHRPPIAETRARQTITRWGERLREYRSTNKGRERIHPVP